MGGIHRDNGRVLGLCYGHLPLKIFAICVRLEVSKEANKSVNFVEILGPTRWLICSLSGHLGIV